MTEPTRARGKLVVERTRNEVAVTVVCPDDYAAIALFDILPLLKAGDS